jgi:hypothetical protein
MNLDEIKRAQDERDAIQSSRMFYSNASLNKIKSHINEGDNVDGQVKLDGNKNDQGKPAMGLLPQEALEEIAKVLTYGREKYGGWNWAKGLKWERVLSAVYRHLSSFQQKQDLDDESKLPHLAHAACGILFLLTYQLRNLGEDDRYDRNLSSK